MTAESGERPCRLRLRGKTLTPTPVKEGACLFFCGSFLTTSVEGPSQRPPCAEQGRLADLVRHKGLLHPRRDLRRAQPGQVTSPLAALPHGQDLQAPRCHKGWGHVCAGGPGRNQLGTSLGCHAGRSQAPQDTCKY